jgi:hypothetical protein
MSFTQTYAEFLASQESECAICGEKFLFTDANLAVFDGIPHVYCGSRCGWAPVVMCDRPHLLRYIQETDQL